MVNSEKNITEFEYRTIDIIIHEKQKENSLKTRNEHNFEDLLDYSKISNIRAIKVPKREEKVGESESKK